MPASLGPDVFVVDLVSIRGSLDAVYGLRSAAAAHTRSRLAQRALELLFCEVASSGWIRTSNPPVNSCEMVISH